MSNQDESLTEESNSAVFARFAAKVGLPAEKQRAGRRVKTSAIAGLVADLARGVPVREAAKNNNISPAAVTKWQAEYRRLVKAGAIERSSDPATIESRPAVPRQPVTQDPDEELVDIDDMFREPIKQ
jgi:hypothetical protein